MSATVALRLWHAYLVAFGVSHIWSLARRFAWSLVFQVQMGIEVPHASPYVTGLYLLWASSTSCR